MAKYLNTRDLEERRQELQNLKEYREEWEALGDEAQEDTDEPDELTDDEEEELKELDALASEIGGWHHGETLIPESDFIDYVEDLARDIGAIGESADWIVIDWDATAENVKQDYTTVTYQGEDYLVRS